MKSLMHERLLKFQYNFMFPFPSFHGKPAHGESRSNHGNNDEKDLPV